MGSLSDRLVVDRTSEIELFDVIHFTDGKSNDLSIRPVFRENVFGDSFDTRSGELGMVSELTLVDEVTGEVISSVGVAECDVMCLVSRVAGGRDFEVYRLGDLMYG